MDRNTLTEIIPSFNIDYETGPEIDESGSEVIHYDNPGFKVFARKNHNLAREIYPGMRIHWHDEIEVIYVRKGYLSYIVNDDKVRLNEGDGIAVYSRQLHIIVNEDSDSDLDCVIFHPDILCSSDYVRDSFVHPATEDAAPSYILLKGSSPNDKIILDDFGQIAELYYLGGHEMEIISILYRAFMKLFEKSQSGYEGKSYPIGELETMRRMLTFIFDHYPEKISISDLCRAGNVGKNTCTGLFTKYTEKSPIEYLRHFRIKRSMQLLEETHMSITDIAFSVGFNSASFFSKTFLHYYGITPREYRRGE